jgi:concentrative nucleoside transporter, CNT family
MLSTLWSIGGILVLIALATLLSKKRKAINWRTVGGGLVILLIFAFFVLKTSIGQIILGWLVGAVNAVMKYTQEGVDFLLGPVINHDNLGSAFVFTSLPSIVFLSAIIAVLYHFGIMQKLIQVIGGGLSKLLGTSKAESLNAAGNIFVGQTEAPILIKPFIKRMTDSELFAVMVGGLASVAGSILVGYAALGIELKYLITAAFMAAPSALVMAKLMLPETEQHKVQDVKDVKNEEETGNFIDALAVGGANGFKLAVNVAVMLLVFVAAIALVNGVLGGVSGLFGYSITLEQILGYVFAPLAFVIGVPFDEALRAASFIGQKFVLNEFVAFSSFGPVVGEFSEKAQLITTFALTGFANISCIGIQLGGIGGMAPSRRKDIARLGFRAVIAATLANLLSAAVAGMFLF